jgi:hypothetical protein
MEGRDLRWLDPLISEATRRLLYGRGEGEDPMAMGYVEYVDLGRGIEVGLLNAEAERREKQRGQGR